MSELFVEGVEDPDGDRPRIKLTAFSPSDDQAPGEQHHWHAALHRKQLCQ